MGIKKFFKIKPPPEDTMEQNRENLSTEGITVKNPNRVRQQKFAAYGQFAREKATDKFYSPPGYENYANPQQQGPEGEESDDLNKAPIDPKTGSAGENGMSPQKEQKKKRGLFGRKKSHSSKDEDEAAQHPAYDPYAVNTDLNNSPFSIIGNNNVNPSNSDGYTNTGNSRIPNVPTTDPYASFNSNKNNNNRLGDNNDSSSPAGYTTDPYSQLNRRSVNNSFNRGAGDNSHAVSRDSSLNNGSNSGYGSSPYGAREPNRKEASIPIQSDPYSSRDETRYGSEAPVTTNPYGSRGTSRRATSEPSAVNSPVSRNSINSTRVPNAAVSAPYSGRISASRQPQPNAIPTDLNALGGSQGSSTSRINPYTSMNAAPYGGSPGPNSGSNPYEAMNGGNVYSVKNDTNTYGSGPQTNPYGGLNRVETFNDTKSTRYAASMLNNPPVRVQELVDSPNDVAVNDDVDLNETLQEYNVADEGDDLNADLSERMQHEQFAPQQQLQQEVYNPALETSQQQTQYGGYYESPRLEDKGFKTFDEVQHEEEERQQQEEDEAVDELKQEIRFTKQSSVASTRNTLKMAQEAEMAGMNTLGMLGHQSEKINNVERNLDLIKIQNSVADDKVSELKKLNRNILAVHVSNPFNSKRRQLEREERIKNKKVEEKMMREYTHNDIEQSTRRIENAMNSNMTSDSGVREKYQRQKVLDAAKKYQFENDEEDDEMEVEIDRNLSQIQQVSGRLKKLALSAGEEIDAQQQRLDRVENSTDDLDIKINMNTTKLSYIK